MDFSPSIYLLDTKEVNCSTNLKYTTMKKAINLNSSEWCEVVFEGKNKAYGAYAMRQTSSKRHIIAFGIIILFVAFVTVLPAIISKVNASVRNTTEGMTQTVEITVMEHETKTEDIIPEIPQLERPPVINSIKYTPPTIVKDEQIVEEEEELKSMDEVVLSKSVVGYMNVKDGTDDANAELARSIMATGNGEGNGGGESTNTIFKTAEVMPQFPGGLDEMYKFIGDNLKYPILDQEMGTQGRVTIQFVVSQTGDIKNVVVLRGVSPNCDKEALRVVKSMPKWIPGRQNGTAVQVYFTLPIQFKLK